MSTSPTHYQQVFSLASDDVAARISLARRLAEADTIDVQAALALLNTMPPTIGAELKQAVDHTRRAVAAAPGCDERHGAVARYMLARLAVMIDRAARCE